MRVFDGSKVQQDKNIVIIFFLLVMCELKEEICQLLKLVLSFEGYVQNQRQKLFTKYRITDDSLWGYCFGLGNVKIGDKNMEILMNKNGCDVGVEGCQLICDRYSSYGDGLLDRLDFWEIFRPKSVKMMEEILQGRRKKNVVPQVMELHYEAKQLMMRILQKTIEYERYAKKMKKRINGLKDGFDKIKLERIDEGCLQIFLHQYVPLISKKDCRIILEHVVGLKKNREKFFYTFLFAEERVGKVNPIQKMKGVDYESLDLYGKSKKVWGYGRNYENHKKPLYLA